MKKKQNAYFTVEAAMIMPFMVLVQVAIIFLLFFQYNRCLMEQDAAVLALRAGIMAKEDDRTLLEHMKREAQKISQDKYLAWEYASPTLQLKKNKVDIRQECQQIFPFLHVELQKKSIWNASITYEVERISPMDVVRSWER